MFDALHLQRFLRAVAGGGRTAVRVAPFTAYFDPSDSLRFLNYAIPDDGAEPDGRAIELLRDAFRPRARLPRLEWVEEAAPRVADALAEAGMQEELRSPLMACRPQEIVRPEADVAALTVAPVGDADLREAADLQSVAFDGRPLPEDEEPRDPRRRGGGCVLARSGPEAVAAAAWTPISDGVTEIVGVATAAAWRGRGLAGTVTAAAAQAAAEAGAVLCVLSPGSDVAQRVYARAGFQPAATMLHWSDPPPPSAHEPVSD